MTKNIIKLSNVSKYYYSKGVIASGFTKVNLEFKIGEFVAITGESGSGKSTLLNVISGLDTYEEGEMYINGEETSHYNEKDFEDYRRKYIGNIFQNFNLINSYTVYQNIELVLLLNGNTKKEIKPKVLELIKTVNLEKFKNTKVSKLSGGQKQRVAIARALAKDTPIIIADEPTGSLDSKSAKSIIKLLNKISKNKLVIIVTHNYEQVEEYVTRKIKMHDGKILEDKQIKQPQLIDNITIPKYKDIKLLSKLRLGIRNSYNIIPKFLLVLAVYLFIIVSLMAEYSSFKQQEYISSKSGYNYFFKNISDLRIIIKKKDKSSFTQEEYDNLSQNKNIDYIIKNDLLLDNTITFVTSEDYWLYADINNINNLKGKLDLGRMPKEDNEVIIAGSKDDYYTGYLADKIIKQDLYLQDEDGETIDKSLKLKIVGIKYIDNTNYYNSDNTIYVSNYVQDKLTYKINEQYSNLKVLFENTYISVPKIVFNNNVEKGKVYISNELNYLCQNNNCLNHNLSIELTNLYYNKTLNFKVSQTYSKQNIKKLLNIENYDTISGDIFINPDDYNSLFNTLPYQSSIFVKNPSLTDETASYLETQGYQTLKMKDTLIKDAEIQILQIMKTVVTIILVVVLFFISYFVIRLILKSRNIYFTTLRMLGATKKVSKQLLIIELLTVSNIAYFIFLTVIYLNKINKININFINTIITYLKLKDYIILYLILIFISYLISIKFSKKLFKNSAMKTIKEEV